jgi:hypothetical protein
MRKNSFQAIVIGSVALAVLGMGRQTMAQDAGMKYTYTKMAPVEQYLMTDRAAEIALARTAAPASLAGDAEVQVLGRHGFETAVKGKNGFVCIVNRSWTSGPDFWNPKVRVPMCFNPAGARSYLVRVNKETVWGLAGHTEAQMNADIPAALASKELPSMLPGAMCYMMSKQGYGGERIPHWPSHVMFFFSDTDPASWGANLPGSPVIAVDDPVEHLTQFVIPVQRWSDGTEAPAVAGIHHH